MGCNCKRKIELEDKYGEKVEEGLLERLTRGIVRALLALTTVVFAIVITPFAIIYLLLKLFFSRDKGIMFPTDRKQRPTAIANAAALKQ